MPATILCPNPDCGASYTVVDENLAKLGRCKECGTKFPLTLPTKDGGRSSPASETDLDSAPKRSEPALPESFGRYKIVRLLGRGGMGSVYLALDTRLKRQVALKVPHVVAFADRPDVRVRFFREAEAAARFHHPNFCPIFDIGEVDGTPYLTMAYIEGKPLSASIERGEGWEPRRAAGVARQLVEALAELHRQGIVHRDLKPANVMVDARGNLVLMDFGLARWYDELDSTFTPTGAILGTPAYMPPEQAEGNLKAVGPRSDLYSLGVILYELLTGRRPFEGPITKVLGMIAYAEPPPPSSHRPGLDTALESICLKAMAKRPDDRYASMDELAQTLVAFLGGEVAPRPAEEQSAQVFAEIVGREPTSLGGARPPVEPILADSEDWSPRPLPQPRSRPPILARVVAVAAAAALLFGIVHIAKNPVLNVALEPTSPEAAPSGNPSPPPATITKVEKAGSSPVDIPRTRELPKSSAEMVPPASTKVDDSIITNTLGMKLQLIPAGEFDMGSDATDLDAEIDEKVDGKKHPVRITRPFYLGTTEVTVGQFRRFVEKASYRTEAERDGEGGFGWDEAKGTFDQGPKYTWRSPGFPQEDDHPVVNVSWNDAVAFCDWLSKEEGQVYRLPTEAEWEYACRAGRTTRYWSGDDPESLATVGNVADGTAKEKYPGWKFSIQAKDGHVFTASVGRFRPNTFGLYHMHGNVWEWCADWYNSDYYSRSPTADPLNLSPASARVIRGGSWRDDPRDSRSAYRLKYAPGDRLLDLGFRLARVR
jgi:formylglycine-generating enzyme required for sulfatase activity